MFLIQKLSILIFRKEILYLGYYEYRREKMSYAKIKEIYGQYGNYFD